MRSFLELILPACGVLLCAAVSGMCLLWLRNRLGKERFSCLCEYAKRAVAAAEQVMNGKSGEEKLTYVKSQLQAAGFSLRADAEIAIESAVLEQKTKEKTNA